MHQKLLEITRKIELASRQLTLEYRPDQLYAFRVSARTIRSILKQLGSRKPRGFRKSWGGFAAATNEARDWDVFLVTAEKLLSADDYRNFEQAHRERIQFSHDTAIEMLNSAPWNRHMQGWNQFLEQAEENAPGKNQGPDALERALSRVRRALQRALATDNDRRWHKFRIAVKEVRYIAEAWPREPATEQHLSMVINACKKLQTLLGDWHDTVVQLSLLDELEPSPVHERLKSMIGLRKQEFLSQIRDMLAEVPYF
jgi:CHAD domain-containing protein